MMPMFFSDPYKLFTVFSVLLATLALAWLYWMLRERSLEATEEVPNLGSREAARHPTFQKLEQTLSQQLIQAVIDKLHEIESIEDQGIQSLSLSDERIMSYASLLVQLRKTEVSTAEIHHMMSK